MSLSKRMGFLFVAFALVGAGCTPSDIEEELGTVPLSGLWSFDLSGSTASLSGTQCPSGAAGFSSAGNADLTASETGDAVSMSLDGQHLAFYRSSPSQAFYQTGTRLFPVRTPGGVIAGTVFFDFVANTEDTIIGTLHWNNNWNCRGEYPFTMELLEAELPGNATTAPYVLSEGSWSLAVSDVQDDCASGIANFTSLPETVELSHTLDLDTGEPDPGSVLISPANVVLERFPSSNTYTQGEETFDLGTPIDESGDVLLDFEEEVFEGRLEMDAENGTSMTGTLYAGSGTCNVSASVTMSFIGP